MPGSLCIYSGIIPYLRIFPLRVEGLSPRRAAAPDAPEILPLVAFRVFLIWLMITISRGAISSWEQGCRASGDVQAARQVRLIESADHGVVLRQLSLRAFRVVTRCCAVQDRDSLTARVAHAAIEPLRSLEELRCRELSRGAEDAVKTYKNIAVAIRNRERIVEIPAPISSKRGAPQIP